MSTTRLSTIAVPGRPYPGFAAKRANWLAFVFDTLAPIEDESLTDLQLTRFARVADSLWMVSDELFPPPLVALNLSGAKGDILPIIIDRPNAIYARSFIANIRDSLDVIHDLIRSGTINLETPARWVAPVSITPRSVSIEPLYLSVHPVRHPDRYYEPRVKSYGIFTRAISAPVGFQKTGDVTISLADPDNSLRRRIAAKTIRKAKAEVRLGPEGGALSAFLRPLMREVGTVSQPGDGELSMSLRDFLFDKLEEQLPTIITTEYFPNLPESPARDYAPNIVGIVTAVDGAIPLFLVDTVSFGYLIAGHPCLSVDQVYRKASGEEVFSLVSSSEYTVDNDPYCVINFTADQADAEIRANVHGYYDAETGLLRATNFSDFILEVLTVMMGVEESLDRINLNSFDETHTRTEAAGLSCGGAILERLTYAEVLTRLQRSSNIDLFADKNDRMTVHYTTDDEDPTVDLDDLLRLHKGSVRQQLAEPTFNQIPYKYAQNYATGKWTENIWDNPVDQEALGEEIPDESLQLYFIRDAAMAISVVERRGQYLDLDSFRFEAEIPLIPVLENIELADLVTITHFGGIKAGGYAGEQFKILELGMDVDNLKYLVKGIRRRLPPPSKIANATIDGHLKANARCGPYYLGNEGELWGCFAYLESMRIWHTTDWGVTWAIADEANQPEGLLAIQSFDSCVNGDQIHVATQTADGVVEYHLFDTSTAKWITVREALTSVLDSGVPCVSVECRYPGNEPLVYYQGPRELQAGQMVGRGYYRILLDGVWTAASLATAVPPPIEMANSIGCTIQRAIPGRDNRMHFMYAVGDGVIYREFACTLLGDLTLGSATRLWTTTWVFYPARHNTGGWVLSEDRTRIYRLWRGSFGSGHIDRINEGEVLSRIAWTDWITPDPNGITDSFEGGAYPQGFLAIDGSDLYFVYSGAYNYITYQKSTNEGPWTAPIKSGPGLVYREYINECFGNMYKVRGKLYFTYFWGPDYPTFGWVRVDELPYDSYSGTWVPE